MWIGRRAIQLPDPIEQTFEDFNSAIDGEVPPGWTVQSLSETEVSNNQAQDNFGLDLARNWRIVSRDRIESLSSRLASRMLTVRPNQTVNDRPVARLMDGNFARANSRQPKFLLTPEFDCSGAERCTRRIPLHVSHGPQ